MIQFAKLSGFSPIITTASLQHDAYLKSLGATHTIDRHQPLSALPAAVRAITSVPVKFAYDTITEGETTNTLLDVLAPGGQIVITLPPTIDQAKLAGKELVHVFGNVHHPTQGEAGVELYKHVTPLLEAGEIKVSFCRCMIEICATDKPFSRTGLRCCRTVSAVFPMGSRSLGTGKLVRRSSLRGRGRLHEGKETLKFTINVF